MRRPLRFPQLAFVLAVSLAAFAGGTITALAAQTSSVRVQVVDADGLPVRDAVVELHSAHGRSVPIRFPWTMGMAQKNQQFTPGTLVIAKGSKVAFPNLDTVRHSIYSFSAPARFEIDLYGRDQTRTHTFPVVGSVKLGCNIHDQMRGYIRITDTPFAGKTDHNGYVALEGAPTGNASLTVWHPQLRAPGNQTKSAFAVGRGAQTLKLKVNLR